MQISIHRFETFAQCPQRYYLRFGKKLIPKFTDVPLRVGRAAHTWLEIWYRNQALPFEQRAAEAHKALVADFRSTAPKPTVGEIEENVLRHTLRLMDGYLRKYGQADEFAVFEPEVEGIVPLPGGHTLKFRSDAPIQYEGNLWVLETKTTEKAGPSLFRQYQFSHQLNAYLYGLSRQLHRPVVGVILNVLRRESDRIEMDFNREYLPIQPEHVKKTLSSLAQVATDIESRDLTDSSHWPYYTHSCGRCWFRPICVNGVPAEPGQVYTLDTRLNEPKPQEEPPRSEFGGDAP